MQWRVICGVSGGAEQVRGVLLSWEGAEWLGSRCMVAEDSQRRRVVHDICGVGKGLRGGMYWCAPQMSKVSDTTAAQARRGKDIQGIPWDRLQFTREKYRETRLQQYKNYVNLLQPHDELEKVSVDAVLCMYSVGCRSHGGWSFHRGEFLPHAIDWDCRVHRSARR